MWSSISTLFVDAEETIEIQVKEIDSFIIDDAIEEMVSSMLYIFSSKTKIELCLKLCILMITKAAKLFILS